MLILFGLMTKRALRTKAGFTLVCIITENLIQILIQTLMDLVVAVAGLALTLFRFGTDETRKLPLALCNTIMVAYVKFKEAAEINACLLVIDRLWALANPLSFHTFDKR